MKCTLLRVSFWLSLSLHLLALGSTQLLAAEADVCAVCGGPFGDVYYSIEDKVTLEKKHVCKTCDQTFPDCFICGVPANTNLAGFIELPDKRALCARDAKIAVLREEDGLRICRDALDQVDRLFSRFTDFPETNVTVRIVDRVHLLKLFKLAGNDYQCPNVWGITDTKTNRNHNAYTISLMSGLPLSWFQATCAHEYGHTWVGEHLSKARKDTISKDAEEGFCELLGFLFMESANDPSATSMILRNAYTRGQIDLFVAAQRSYGFNEILDWMQFGSDDRLSADEPGRIRRIVQSGSKPTLKVALAAPRASGRSAPDSLVLKAIFWDPKQPTALINDRSFSLNEEAAVRVGKSNVLVRCLAISPDSVQLRVAGSDHEQTLRLK
jgi:hypothetical protein